MMTILWAATTFIFLVMPLNATAAHILVAAAAFGGPHAQRAGLLFTSGDESFCTCLEHTWNLMMLCSLMRMARLVTLQLVRSGRAFFGACVCCRVSTIVAQTCAVTSVKRAMRHRPFTTHPSPPPTLEEPRGRTYATVWADQGHS